MEDVKEFKVIDVYVEHNVEEINIEEFIVEDSNVKDVNV